MLNVLKMPKDPSLACWALFHQYMHEGDIAMGEIDKNRESAFENARWARCRYAVPVAVPVAVAVCGGGAGTRCRCAVPMPVPVPVPGLLSPVS